MYYVFVLFFVALNIAAPDSSSTFNLFKATEYFKTHADVSRSCFNNKFKGSSCNKAFLSFAPVAIEADGAMYYETKYCVGHKTRCTKCVANWKKGQMKLLCNSAKKALANLYTPVTNEEVETPEPATPVEPETQEIEPETPEEIEPETPEEIEPETPVQTFPDLKEGLAQDPMAFYKAVSVGKGKPVAKLGTTGVSLYDGLPWESNDIAFELDNSKVKEYLKNILGKEPSFTIATDNHCVKPNQNIDGVLSADIAALPILAFREINDAGVPLNWTRNTRPKKLAAILKRKSDGEIFYLPCTCSPKGDAKGHTWPGGVAQTFLSNDRQKKNAWRFNSDGGHITGPIINTTVKTLSAIRSGFSKVKYCRSPVSVQINLETSDKYATPLRKSYTLAGFVGWKQ